MSQNPDVPDKPVISPLPVSAIVLAAGLGRRMKTENKLLALLDGLPVLRRVVNTVLASNCERTVVVLGHENSQIRQALDGLDIDYVFNPDYMQGMGTSVRTGASAIDPCHAALVVLGDMPLVQPDTINSLISAYQNHPDKAAYLPVYKNRRGNPVLWAPSHLGLLQSLAGDEGARAALARLGAQVFEVPVTGPGIHTDIDTPDELALSRAEWAKHTAP